jgi:hypothetical protein
MLAVAAKIAPGTETMTTDPEPELDPELEFDPELELDEGAAPHVHLIDMAHELPAIANKGDHVRLSLAASSLLEAFVRHAEDERSLVLRLPPITARLVENGQQRVVDHLVSLVLEADLAEEPCRCALLADEVASLIEVQIMSEEWDQTDR